MREAKRRKKEEQEKKKSKEKSRTREEKEGRKKYTREVKWRYGSKRRKQETKAFEFHGTLFTPVSLSKRFFSSMSLIIVDTDNQGYDSNLVPMQPTDMSVHLLDYTSL